MTAPVWLIAGPTASGKSAHALALADRLGAEIVNADALQIYADLSLLSARPSEDEMGDIRHHLYGLADAADSWSVGRWLRAAVSVLDEIAARGRPAVVVGGTGLYFRALTHGLAEVPAVAAETRDRVASRFDKEGEAAFRARLAAADPLAETRIAPGDRQRLVRATAVWEASGRALSAWQADTGPAPLADWRGLVIEPDRELLYARCDTRFDMMMAAGALDEVRALVGRGLPAEASAMKAVGVRELAAHLAGELSLDEAVEVAKRETRRYAKRQLTWFRNQTPDWERVRPT
jgi:tRNA dimethylallyltransferase